MSDTIDVPLAGKQDKKVVLIGGGIVLIVGVYFYRKQKANTAAATAAQQTAANTTAAGDTGTTIDPQTGYPYGSPEDQAALASMSYGLLPTQYGGGYGGYGGSGGTPNTGPTGFVSNAQWAQAAEAAMGSNGNDAIAAALGKYLTGQPVTSDQQTLIQEAIAIEGMPPVAGTGGFPPSIKTSSGGPPPATLSVRITSARYDNVSATWNADPSATSYEVVVTTHMGTQTLKSQVVNGTSVTVGGLPQKTDMAVHVTAVPSGATGVAYTNTR